MIATSVENCGKVFQSLAQRRAMFQRLQHQAGSGHGSGKLRATGKHCARRCRVSVHRILIILVIYLEVIFRLVA
jgi:hypothetical protein